MIVSVRSFKWQLFNAARRLLRVSDWQPQSNHIVAGVSGNMPSNRLSKVLDWYLPGYEINALSCAQLKCKADIYLVLDMEQINFPSLLRKSALSYIVDPQFFSTAEVSNWNSMLYSLLSPSEKKEYQDRSVKNYTEFSKRHQDCSSAYIYGSGPSVEDYLQWPKGKRDVSIICNSLVKNDEFLAYVRPDAVCFADPVFHFSHNPYAMQFRADLLACLQKYDCYAFIPAFTMPLMCRHFPEWSERFIGINFDNHFNLPTADKLSVKGTDNILTLFMLPLAASMCKTLNLLGMDGKNPKSGASYFWAHHDAFQYVNLIQKAQEAHPSFFRDRSYEGYSHQHEKTLEHMIRWLERKQIKINVLNPSFIPALKHRYYTK